MDTKIGCFGSVLYHDAGSKRCQQCALHAECEVEAASNKVKLDEWYAQLRTAATTRNASSKKRGAIGVQPIAAPVVEARVAATATTTRPLIASGKKLPKKPKEFVDKWCKQGIKFEEYKQGTNPFATCGNKFAAVAMDVFLQGGKKGVAGRATKDDLIDTFVAKFNWMLGTASSHANIVFDAFEYLGIIAVHGQQGYLVNHE